MALLWMVVLAMPWYMDGNYVSAIFGGIAGFLLGSMMDA